MVLLTFPVEKNLFPVLYFGILEFLSLFEQEFRTGWAENRLGHLKDVTHTAFQQGGKNVKT